MQAVHIAAHQREAFERLLRDFARPAFAQKRLRQIDPARDRYDAPKSGPTGNVSLVVSPSNCSIPWQPSSLRPVLTAIGTSAALHPTPPFANPLPCGHRPTARKTVLANLTIHSVPPRAPWCLAHAGRSIS